ncbi:hypothetical protein ABBQ38_010365 [Trebouxia sp. C0009 RCD-2024]
MLQDVDLSNNRLSGTVSNLASFCLDLRELNLSNNSLSGPLPDLLSQARMKTLDFHQNGFIGSIPFYWDSLVNLKALDLSYNQLTGNLPDAWDGFAFSSLSIYFSGLTARNRTNAEGARLPPFAMSGATRTFASANAVCMAIAPDRTHMPSLQMLQIAPDYSNYEQCSCSAGFKRNGSGFAGLQGELL